MPATENVQLSKSGTVDAHKSRATFSSDLEWQKVKAASEANGPIVTKVESVFVKATDYSPMQ